MQACETEAAKTPIMLGSLPGDHKVEGFAEAYGAYIADRPEEELASVIFRWFLMALGLVIGFVGAITIIFGPSMITYSATSGPTAYQMIQMYPGPIFSVGALLFAASNYLEINAKQSVLAPEVFVREICSFIGPDGTDCNEKIIIQHLGDDDFHILDNGVA